MLGTSRISIEKYILRVHSDAEKQVEDTVVKLVMKAAIGKFDEHFPFYVLQTAVWLRITLIFNAVPLLLCIPCQHYSFQVRC